MKQEYYRVRNNVVLMYIYIYTSLGLYSDLDIIPILLVGIFDNSENSNFGGNLIIKNTY